MYGSYHEAEEEELHEAGGRRLQCSQLYGRSSVQRGQVGRGRLGGGELQRHLGGGVAVANLGHADVTVIQWTHVQTAHLLGLGLGLRLHGLYGGGRGRGRAVGRGGLGRGLGPVHAGVRTPVKAAQAVIGTICNQSTHSNISRYP